MTSASGKSQIIRSLLNGFYLCAFVPFTLVLPTFFLVICTFTSLIFARIRRYYNIHDLQMHRQTLKNHRSLSNSFYCHVFVVTRLKNFFSLNITCAKFLGIKTLSLC